MRSFGICPDLKPYDRGDRSLQGGPDICKRRADHPARRAFDRADYYLALRFFRPGFAIRKSSRFLPALISRANQPAVPPLPLQVSPVFGWRYFGATFVPFTEPAFLTP